MNPANALSQLSPGMAECHARLMAVAKHGTPEAFSATLAGVLQRAELSISNAYDAGAKSIQVEAVAAPAAANEITKAFREYLTVHPGIKLGGHEADTVARELALIAQPDAQPFSDDTDDDWSKSEIDAAIKVNAPPCIEAVINPDVAATALRAYIKDCEAHAIVPDVGGAWHATFLAGAASRTQPPAGVSSAADELTRDLKNAIDTATELRQQLRLMEESARGEIWRWQADGVDNLATMGNRMGVLIYASDLRNLIASASAKAQAARAGAMDTKTHELLSTTVGLLMGYREGGARQPYKPGSMIAKVVDEVVDHLKDWPHPEPTTTAQATPAGATFQQRVRPWLLECFGAEIAADRVERNHRFLEESLELVQALGCTASEAHQLVDYVFGRAVGDPPQEVGGVMVTLAALCLASGLDMHDAGEVELARISAPELVATIRAKQAAKPKHSPLPEATTAQAAPAAGAVAGMPPGISALMCVISSLRDTAHFSDEEGELTDELRTLRDWAMTQAAAPTPAAQQGDARLGAIEQAIRDYHYALDTRQHGGVAQDRAIISICTTLDMHWAQGKEASRRATLAQKEGNTHAN